MNYYFISLFIIQIAGSIAISSQKLGSSLPIYSSINYVIDKYFDRSHNEPALSKKTYKKPQPLSVLMYFNLDGTSSFNLVDSFGIYWSDIGNCAHGQMFDPVIGICRDIFCMEGFYLSDDGCSSNKTHSRKNQSYIAEEMSIELNFNNKLCSLYIGIDELKECDTKIFHIDDTSKDEFKNSLAKELNVTKNRLDDFTILNRHIFYQKFNKVFLNASEIDNLNGVSKFERFKVTFKILSNKKFENEEEETIIVYFKIVAIALINRKLIIEDREQFSITDVFEVKESGHIGWCGDQKDKLEYLSSGFRILTLPQNVDSDHNYFIYVEETGQLYETGEFYLTVFFDPKNGSDTGSPQFESYENIRTSNCSVDKYKWTVNDSYLDITDYVLEKNSSQVNTFTTLAVCDRTPKINDCETHKVLRAKKCEFEYKKLRREYCWERISTCLSINDYEIDPEFPKVYIRVCQDIVEKLKTPHEESTIEKVTSWLSFLSIIISIIFLVFTLFTYMLFEKLRNVPAWNIINLTLALFIAQLSFIFGSVLTENHFACFIVSILTHYGFLAAFFWMNISAFDLYRNFSKNGSHVLLHMVTLKERLPKYLIYGWLTPIALVTICLAIDLASMDSMDESLRPCYAGFLTGCDKITYNYNNMSNLTNTTKSLGCFTDEKINTKYYFIKSCYIQNGKANLLFFGLPIAVIILINAIFYFMTIYNIRQWKTKHKKTHLRRISRGKVASDDDVKFYIQMAFIMGFTWICGFFSSSYQDDKKIIIYEVLVFFFIISNGLIGIFIFFVFIFRKDVIKLYKNLILVKILKVRKEPLSEIYSIKLSNNY